MCATWLASFIFACACYITGWPIKLLKLLLISTCCYNELKFIIYTFVLSVIETMKMISCLSKWDQDLPIKDDRRIMICDVRDGSRILFLQVWVGLVCCHGCLNWISFRSTRYFLGFYTLKCSRCDTWNFGLKKSRSGVNFKWNPNSCLGLENR